MKPLFLLITICVLFSCSDDNNNDEIDEDRLITNFKTFYESTIDFVELKKMVEGDSVFKIGGETKTGILNYSISSQVPKNAFKIDADTGIIRVNDEELIHTIPLNNVFAINVEIKNQYTAVSSKLNLYVNTWISSECEQAMEKFNEAFSEVIGEDLYSGLNLQGNEFQLSFSVNSDKSLCGIDQFCVSNNGNPIVVELTDSEGENVLKENLLAYDADGWAGPDYKYAYNELRYLDIPLKANVVYTLKLTGDNFASYAYQKKNAETIVFPFDLKVFTIEGTQFEDLKGVVNVDTVILFRIFLIDNE